MFRLTRRAWSGILLFLVGVALARGGALLGAGTFGAVAGQTSLAAGGIIVGPFLALIGLFVLIPRGPR